MLMHPRAPAHPPPAHAFFPLHAHDPELEAHQYERLASGRFCLVRTQSGRYYACIEVDTLLGHVCAMIELSPAAAHALARAQHEHVRAQQRAQSAGFAFGDEMTTGFAFGDEMTTGFSFGDITHAIEHIAAPVVHAVTDVANKASHAIDAAAKSATHGVSDAVKAAARIVAKAHLGDTVAGKFIRDIVHGAEQGVAAARKAADTLAKGAIFVAHHIDLPKVLADAIPIPAVRKVAQSVLGMVDPNAKFADAVDALRRGDFKRLKAMAQQDLSEAQGVISLIPGIGTGVSAALSAAEALLNGGAPLEIAIRAAYGAIPIPPGVRDITDMVLDAVLKIIEGGSITDAALAMARDRVPSGIPRDVFDTLVNVVAKHQPIVKAAEQLAGHYVAQYTQGLASAVEHGLSSAVAPLAAQVLRQLPDASTKFASFAPVLKDVTKVADQLRKPLATVQNLSHAVHLPALPPQVRMAAHAFPLHFGARGAP
jgi:hypothetical protein